MPQAYFSLVTNAGKIKLAQSAAGGGAVVITHFGIGDGNGAETNPTAASTALVREVWRTGVESVVTDPENPSAILVTAIIPTTAGGWWMREFGVFDQAGTMIAVAKPVSQYKPTAAEGQLEDIRYEFQIIIGETANVTLLVDPSLLFATRAWVEARKIPMAQMMRLPWLPLVSMTTLAPPAAPAQGAAYLIPAGATGVWAGNVGKIAEWTGSAWTYSTASDGHGMALPDGRVFLRRGGSYLELAATETFRGLVKLATEAETKDAAGDGVVVAKWLKEYGRVVQGDVTLYVRADGNDNNTGLANTAGGAFRTLQGAIDTIGKKFSGGGGFKITIQVGAGTGFGAAMIRGLAGFRLEIIGAGATTIIDAAGALYAIRIEGAVEVTIRSMMLTGTRFLLSALYGADVRFSDIKFVGGNEYQVAVGSGASVTLIGSITIEKNATLPKACFASSVGGVLDLTGQSITLIGAPEFVSAFIYAAGGAVLGQAMTFVGTAVGRRYLVAIGGVIYTDGAGASYFPGTVAGQLLTGGIYV